MHLAAQPDRMELRLTYSVPSGISVEYIVQANWRAYAHWKFVVVGSRVGTARDSVHSAILFGPDEADASARTKEELILVTERCVALAVKHFEEVVYYVHSTRT